MGRGIYVDRLLDLHGDVFGDLLSDSRTLMYMCGLKGMEVGVYKNMARMGVAEAYLAHKDEPEILARPDDWTPEIMKKIRPTGRAMVEVY